VGRRLPNYLDVNLNPNTMENVTITVSDASGLGPLKNGAQFVVPTYTSYGNTALLGPNAAGYSSITELVSNVNSNYNAMVIEVLNRSLHSIQFDANYTWSHALDFAQNADSEGTTNGWYDPYSNPRINYGNSQFNVPNRFVAYALYNFPNLHTSNWVKYLANDWNIDETFQAQNGLPYTAGVSEYAGVAVGSDWNGSSGSSLIPAIGPETQKYPRKMVDDLRLQKNIQLREGRDLELMANVFNLANHQNIDGLGTTAYELSGSGTAATATYQGQPGTGNDTYKVITSSNNSGFLYTPREVEISARFTF